MLNQSLIGLPCSLPRLNNYRLGYLISIIERRQNRSGIATRIARVNISLTELTVSKVTMPDLFVSQRSTYTRYIERDGTVLKNTKVTNLKNMLDVAGVRCCLRVGLIPTFITTTTRKLN
jgi:hypothetical protein